MAARRFEGVNSFFNFNTRTFIWGIFLQSSAIHGLGVDKFDEIKYIMDHVDLERCSSILPVFYRISKLPIGKHEEVCKPYFERTPLIFNPHR